MSYQSAWNELVNHTLPVTADDGLMLPCPFCGSNNLGIDKFFYVQCQDCKADGPTPPGGDDVARAQCIELWNKRSS